MDIRRTPAAPAARTLSYRQQTPASGSTSRSNSNTSEDNSHRNRGGLRIPGARFDEPPPPLPPPRYNEELAQGIDVAWSWGNSDPFNPNRRLAPIKPGSSLYGGYMGARRSSDHTRDVDDMDLDDDFARRESTVSTVRSPSQATIQLPGPHVPPMIRKHSSPTPANQRLQGDMPLAQQNFNLSSHAYDQRLLSKIGKPTSPPRHSRSSGSADSTAFTQKLSLHTKDPNVQLLSANEHPPASFDPVSRWIASPASAGLSPGSRPGWRDYNTDHRSPSMDSAATSLVLDPELFVQPRPSGLLSIGSSLAGPDDLASIGSRSQRGSYEHGMFPDTESDVAGEEGSGLRNLHLGGESQDSGERRGSSKQGMKRRARSPPSDVARDEKSPSRGNSCSDLFPKFNLPTSARSPAAKYQPKHGSVSSTASSARQNSYASSISLSIAGSSMTSISSFDRQSPLDPAHPAYITSAHPVLSPATSIASSRLLPQVTLDTKSIHSTMSGHTPGAESLPPIGIPPLNRVGNSYICDCCPKKPKKFESEDQLRNHQMEKQYTCQYCNNRFKNKNEAERHQNSLHLRRYSWSCAAIPNYQAAYHPVSTPTTIGSDGPLFDACGYCGEEFPNLPQPDWDRRLDHLTSVHKFGECNHAKKFYRADHFRQHLKHSHAGQSGKWTNMLESVCLREELPQDAAGISPTGSEPSPGRGPSSLPDPPMGGETISESRNET